MIYLYYSNASVKRLNSYSGTFIRGSIGHSDPKTTENYFGNFEQEATKEAAVKLTE